MLHARIVAALEALAGDRRAEQVERLAHHALRGEVWDKALAYCRQAGEKAMARSAHREAVVSFEQALSALPHLPEQRDTREQAIDLRLALRTALRPLGDSGRILAILHEAEALAVALDDSRRLGQVSLFLANYFTSVGAYDQALAAAQRALALATASGDVVLHALVNFRLGNVYHTQSDYRRAIDCYTQTVASLEGARRHERFGIDHPCPPWPPVPGSPCAMLNWACSPRAVPSAKKGSRLPRRLRTPGASWLPRGGSVCWPSAKATCPGHSPCSNGPWASVRMRTSRPISP